MSTFAGLRVSGPTCKGGRSEVSISTSGMRVAIIGTGLIGGSVGLALVRSAKAEAVTLWDPDPDTLACALERGAGTAVARDIRGAVAEADLVLIAAPVDKIVESLPEVALAVSAHTVVSDVGSSKSAIADAGAMIFGAMFVGGHPMAGSEQHGIKAASPDLFEGASWILTPASDTSAETYRRVTDLVTAVGAQAVALPASVHDDLLAQISHLPQLIASLLVDLAAGGSSATTLLPLAGGGFRDVTRIAASSPEMWLPVLKTNRQAIVEAITAFSRRAGELGAWLEEERWDLIQGLLGDARTARLELFHKDSAPGPPVVVSLLIPDRPGVLAQVTTAAGELGVNLEDVQIFHSTEGGRGRLDLVVSGTSDAEELRRRLVQLGYHATQGWHE